jgi:hypothetical protein
MVEQVRHPAADERPVVLAQALAAATACTDDFFRARALAEMASYLPSDLLANVLAAATAIPSARSCPG